jgi:hypothetical protein
MLQIPEFILVASSSKLQMATGLVFFDRSLSAVVLVNGDLQQLE